jgi:hypothetical protein
MKRVLLPIMFFVSSVSFAQKNLFTVSGTGGVGARSQKVQGYGLDLSAIRKLGRIVSRSKRWGRGL